MQSLSCANVKLFLDDLCLQVFRPKFFYAFLITLMGAICPVHLTVHNVIIVIMFTEQRVLQIMALLVKVYDI
jgi:hypothetical protein